MPGGHVCIDDRQVQGREALRQESHAGQSPGHVSRVPPYLILPHQGCCTKVIGRKSLNFNSVFLKVTLIVPFAATLSNV